MLDSKQLQDLTTFQFTERKAIADQELKLGVVMSDQRAQQRKQLSVFAAAAGGRDGEVVMRTAAGGGGRFGEPEGRAER